MARYKAFALIGIAMLFAALGDYIGGTIGIAVIGIFYLAGSFLDAFVCPNEKIT